MNLKGVVVCLVVVLFLGGAAANNDEWSVEPLGTEEPSEGYDYLTYNFDYGDGDIGGSAFYMASGQGGVPDPSQYGGTEVSQYSQYFSMEAPTTGGSGPEKYYVSEEPSMVYFGGQSVPYSTYQTSYGGSNSLWIQGSMGWTQYVVCPMYAYLSILAHTPGGGSADFYEIYPSGRVLQNSYWFSPGYNRMIFQADAVGRHILLFVVNNQPSNVVIVDVRSGGWSPSPGPGPMPGYAKVTVKSSRIRGYNVYVDGGYIGGDCKGGDPCDGIYSFTVTGNQYHTIKVSSSGYTYIKGRNFNSGYHYTLTI